MMMFFPIYWEAKERWNPQYHRVGLKSKDGWQIPRSLQLHMHFHFVLLNFQAGEVLRFTACTMHTLKHQHDPNEIGGWGQGVSCEIARM